MIIAMKIKLTRMELWLISGYMLLKHTDVILMRTVYSMAYLCDGRKGEYHERKTESDCVESKSI